MRILLTLIKSLIILSVLAAVVFFGGREGLLFYAEQTLKSDLNKLRAIDIRPGTYYTRCKQLGSIAEVSVAAIQLRFNDESAYDLEVKCAGGNIDPINVGSGQLPPFVTKQVGTSGLIWGDSTSGIVVEVFGRQRAIVVEDRQVIGGSPQQLYLGSGPATSCEAYGYSCCLVDVEVGLGELKSNTTDCPQACYGSCEARPVVLAFRAGSTVARGLELRIRPGEKVDFFWVVDPGVSDTFTGTIAFGDGQTSNFYEVEGSLSHQYQCATERCEYVAEVAVRNDRGVNSFSNNTSSIKIIVE